MFGAAAFFASGVSADSTVTPGSKAAMEEACVEPTDVMRRDHMEFIKHQRDVTVYQGIRGSKHSLMGCVNCHGAVHNGKAVPVSAEGQFCASCHRFTAVSIDCFQCHRSIPEDASIEGLSLRAIQGHVLALEALPAKLSSDSGQPMPTQQED
jgi:ribosomal protein S26